MILSFNFTGLVLALMGIFIGILFSSLIGLGVAKHSIKKANLENREKLKEEQQDIDNQELVYAKIRSFKDKYKEDAAKGGLNDKVSYFSNNTIKYVESIAKIYYPDSSKPLGELSVSEVLDLINYIDKRLDELFDKNKLTRFIRTKQIKTIKNIILNGIKVFDSEVFKASSKAITIVKSIINIFNPFYWANKFMINFAFNTGLNMVSEILIELIGVESAKVYSKNFNKTPVVIDVEELEQIELNEEEI